MGKESLIKGVMVAVCAVSLAACASSDEESDGDKADANPAPAPVDDPIAGLPYEAVEECPADGLQGLVGTHYTQLDSSTLPDLTRIIGPDNAVTMDFRPERLNIYYDEDGTVTEVRCG